MIIINFKDMVEYTSKDSAKRFPVIRKDKIQGNTFGLK